MKKEIDAIVHTGLIEKNKADYIKEKFENFTSTIEEWSEKANQIVVTDESQKEIMATAREGRLLLKAKRIEVEKVRKSLKEQSLQEGRIIDGVAKYLTSLIEPAEKHLELQEKFIEIKEQEKRLILKQERIKILMPYSDVIDVDSLQLDLMTDEAFETILNGSKVALQKKQEEILRAEKEYIEAKEKEQVFVERSIKIGEYKRFLLPTDIELTKETSETEFLQLFESLQKRYSVHLAEQKVIEIENLKLKKQNEENEREIESLKTIVKKSSFNSDNQIQTIVKVNEQEETLILRQKYQIAKNALDSVLWYVIPFPLRDSINEALKKIEELEKQYK
jgi:hypothetical protein